MNQSSMSTMSQDTDSGEEVNYVRYDLIDKKGARDFIIVDGYALLFTVLNNPYLDWNNHGGQFIHLTSLIGRFIRDLRIREIVFEVVFVGEESERYYFADTPKFNADSVRLAKHVMMSYLKHVDQVVKEFPDDWTHNGTHELVSIYLEKKVPMFMIGTRDCRFGNLFMYYCHHRYKLASVVDITFDANTMHGQFAHFQSSNGNFNIFLESGLQVVAESLQYAKTIDVLPNSVKQSIEELPGSHSERFIVSALCRLLQGSLTQKNTQELKLELIFSQLLLISSLVAKQVPLTSRLQNISHSSERVKQFIYSFYHACLQDSISITDVELFDFFDARLFHRLIASFAQTKREPSLLIQYCGETALFSKARDIMYSIVKVDNNAPDIPIDVYPVSQDKEQLPDVKPLCSVENDLIDEVLENWKDGLATSSESDLPVNPQEQVFTEKYHWHAPRLLEQKEQFLAKTSLQQKNQATAEKRLQEYSKSLLTVIKQKLIEVNASRAEFNNSQVKRRLEKYERDLEKKLSEANNTLRTIVQDARLTALDKVDKLQKWIDEIVVDKLQDDRSGVYNQILSTLREENQIGYDEIELEVLQESQRREREEDQSNNEDWESEIQTAEVKEQDTSNDLLISDLLSSSDQQEEQEEWEALDLDDINPEPTPVPVPVPKAIVPKTVKKEKKDDSTTLKRIQQLQSQIRNKEENLKQLSHRLNILTKCRHNIESLIVLLLHNIANLLTKEEDRDEQLDWLTFEACTLLHSYITHLESEEYRDIVSMRHKLVDVNKAIDKSTIFNDIYNNLCSIGFVEYAKELLGETVTPNRQFKNTQEHISMFQLKNNTSCSAPDKYLGTHELHELNTKLRSSSKLFYPSSEDATIDKMYNLGFKPDLWQKDIIRHVNNQKSIVISAPTSTGKTFIAFYVIEKILRESNNGRVVFVCPTKALVNQIYAEVFARYKKTGTFLGIFTADDQVNVLDSQVLITVPEAFRILLLTAGNHTWRTQLKYIIVDEIHTMNDASTGKTIEHILLMVNCNIIALSATIGNAESFTEWLNYNKKNVELVEFHERPRPLEFFVYSSVYNFVEMHPVSALNPRNVDANAIKNMATFSPPQCLALYLHSQTVAQERRETNIFEGLEPELALTEPKIFSRSDFHSYAEKLKLRLAECALDDTRHEFISDLILSLSKSLERAYDAMPIDHEKVQYLYENMPLLVSSLKSSDMLPAISFSFDRRMCRQFARSVANSLGENDLWKDEYSRSVARNKIDEVIRGLEGIEIDRDLIALLKKGVACHYSSLPDSYCKEVERLFRMKMIPIIFSTTTLALGVNMPCKTVVMAGSSVFLTPSTFYQCAGRSGRRGFDNKGQIVLFGISRAQTNRLLTSKIPKLTGSMGLQHTFVLRLLTLFSDSRSMYQRSEITKSQLQTVISDIKRTLSQPLFVHGQLDPIVKNQVMHHFRYSLEVLRREGYVNASGESIGYAGMVSHLYYHEPANFLLVDFIRSGLIHSVLDQYHDEEERAKALLHILSYLFGRREISLAKSAAVLKPLPTPFIDANNNYSKRLMTVYEQYLYNYAVSYQDILVEKTIPGTEIPVCTDATLLNQFAQEEATVFNPFSVIKENAIPFYSRSAVAANSGHTERYESMSEMIATLNNNIVMDGSLIPNMELNVTLSSYICDFYDKPNLEEIARRHFFISESEASNTITAFNKDLKKIVTSMELMKVRKTDPLLLSTKKLIRELRARLAEHQSYAHSINIVNEAKFFDVTKVADKKRLEMQIVLHKHKVHRTPILSTLVHGERTKFVTLGPWFMTNSSHGRNYLVKKSPTRLELCIKTIKSEYECENADKLIQEVNKYKKMMVLDVHVEAGLLEPLSKERWGDKRHPEDWDM